MTTLRAESPSTVLRATCPKGQTSCLAKNGFEGLEATKNTRPDLVVSDIQMPGMDGFELLREIRAFGPDTAGSIPVYRSSL